MSIRNLTIGLLVVGLLGSVALAADQAQTPDQPKAHKEHKAKFEGKSEGKPAHAKAGADEQVERLTKELGLTPEQQDQLRKLITEFQQQKREQDKARFQENGEKIKELHKQLADARAAKDVAKVRELEGQMRALRGEPQIAALHDKLISEIEKLLSPEQKEKFQQIKGRMFGDRPSIENNPEMLMKAIESLNLPQDRQQQVRAIFEQYKTQVRGSADHKAAARANAPEVSKKILALLNSEEQAKVRAWRPTGKQGEGSEKPAKAEAKAHKAAKAEKKAKATESTEQPK